MRYVPYYINCLHGCKNEYGEPRHAIIQPEIYHFKNTGEPYQLRFCSQCKKYSLVIL
jgi:hypothetical protein